MNGHTFVPKGVQRTHIGDLDERRGLINVLKTGGCHRGKDRPRNNCRVHMAGFVSFPGQHPSYISSPSREAGGSDAVAAGEGNACWTTYTC